VRIHVTGNAGAGKTTLAVKLGQELRMPVIHLDTIVWQPGWKSVPVDQRNEALRLAASPKNWIIEGVSRYIREQADVVVFLDIPRHTCVWRCAKRNWRYLFRSRPEMPIGCPEWRIMARLIRMIWDFPSVVGLHVQAESKNCQKYRILRESAQVDAWFNEFVSTRVV
jgi:adenylate kinase family enzyme